MFGFVINKLKNRKWLNLCLLMGVALFIALFVCHPMFEKGAGNQILDRLFTDHATQQNEFPAQMSREGTYAVADYPDSQSVLDKLSGYEKKWTEYVDINKVSSQQLITLSGGRADTEFGGPNNYFTIGYLPGNIPGTTHKNVIACFWLLLLSCRCAMPDKTYLRV